MDEPVLVQRENAVAVVTLNRPRQRNLLSGDLVDAIAAAYNDLESDGQTVAVVLTGAGSAFCAGADLNTLRASAAGDFALVEAVYNGFLRIKGSPLLTIGAVNGPAVGAGVNLALACDVRLAGPQALFDTRFAQLHIHPGGGHLWMLSRAVGSQAAFLATVFGETWDAEQARQHGLVAKTFADNDALLDGARELAARLNSQSVPYVRRVVQTARSAIQTVTHDLALAAETEAQRWSTTQPEFLDGVASIEAGIAARRGR